MLVCSPLGHMTGFAAGMLLGLKIGASVIFQDVWEPKRGIGIMANEGVTYSAGAATFLADMCEAVAGGAAKPQRLRKFLCAGAPIPPALIDRIMPFVTVYSALPKVNVRDAAPEVIAALPGMTPALLNSFLDRRDGDANGRASRSCRLLRVVGFRRCIRAVKSLPAEITHRGKRRDQQNPTNGPRCGHVGP